MTHATPLASGDWLALVAAIRARPDDDTPRLVAADWLDDARNPSLAAWAELIRVQVAAAGSPAAHPPRDWCDCIGCRADRRTAMLHEQHGNNWHVYQFGHVVTGVPFARASMYERGFVSEVLDILVTPLRNAEIPAACWSVFELTPVVSATFVARRRQRATVYEQARPFVLNIDIHPEEPASKRLGGRTQPISVRVNGHLIGRQAYGTNRVDRLVRGAVRQAIREAVPT